MKLNTIKTSTIEVTSEEISTLITKLLEKKYGKKIIGVDVANKDTYTFRVEDEHDVVNLDEPKG